MVDGAFRMDSSLQEFIHEAVVEIQSFGVPFSPPLWQDARPGNGKTVEVWSYISFRGSMIHQND